MAVDLEELRRRVVRLSDQQLLVMTTWQRSDYRLEALDLADAELQRRGLVSPASAATPAANSQPVAVQRLNSGEDIITKGCLAIFGLVIVFSLTIEFGGFSRWFWPGLWGWLCIPFILAGMFSALGWLWRKLRR